MIVVQDSKGLNSNIGRVLIVLVSSHKCKMKRRVINESNSSVVIKRHREGHGGEKDRKIPNQRRPKKEKK